MKSKFSRRKITIIGAILLFFVAYFVSIADYMHRFGGSIVVLAPREWMVGSDIADGIIGNGYRTSVDTECFGILGVRKVYREKANYSSLHQSPAPRPVHTDSKTKQAPPLVVQGAYMEERDGWMWHQDAIKLFFISLTIEHKHYITDSDLAWAIHVINSKPPIDNENNRNLQRSKVMSLISPLKHWTPHQRDMYLPTVVQSLSSKEWTEREIAVMTAGNMNDARAIPYVIPLTKDSSPVVSQMAVKSLKNLLHMSK